MLQNISRSIYPYLCNIFVHSIVSIHNHCVWRPGGVPSMRMYFRVFKIIHQFLLHVSWFIYLSVMLWVRNWLVTFEVIGFVDRWYHQETGHRCSAELGRGERGFFPLLDCLHLVLKCCYTMSQLPLTIGWPCWNLVGCVNVVHKECTQLLHTLWLSEMSSIHILSPDEFTCFFCKNHFSRAVWFSHPKIPCFGAHVGHLFPRHFWQAHKRAIQAAAPGDLAALGLKLWIFSRLLTVKGKPFIKIYAGWLGA